MVRPWPSRPASVPAPRAVAPPARLPRHLACRVQLLARGQEHPAIGERPAEILRVGELQAVGRERLGELDDLRDVSEVLAVEHHVHGQR